MRFASSKARRGGGGRGPAPTPTPQYAKTIMTVTKAPPDEPPVAIATKAGASCVVAIDTSGSTHRVPRYWGVVNRVVTELRASRPDLQVILWNSEAHVGTPEQVLNVLVRSQIGKGGTEPSSFIPLLPSSVPLFVLITDGQIEPYSVRHVDQSIRNRGMVFGETHVYLVSTWPREMDLSVACPFTRGPHTVWVMPQAAPAPTVARSFTQREQQEIFPLVASIESAADFEDKESLITRWVEMLTMGSTTPSIDALDAVKDMRARIVRAASVAKQGDGRMLYEKLLAHDWEGAEQVAASIARAPPLECLSRVDRLKGYLENGMHTYDVTEAARLRRHAQQTSSATPLEALPEGAEPGADPGGEAASEWRCPVTLSEDSEDLPVIPLRAGPSVFEGLDDKTVDLVMRNPLFAFRHPEILDRLRARLCPAIGLEGFRDMSLRGITLHPTTRDEMLPEAICLGKDESHLRACDTALSVLLHGNRRCGNLNLWFAVLAHVVKDTAFLADAEEHVRRHLLHRLATTLTFASLSGTGPCVAMMPTAAAVWWSRGGAAAVERPGSETVRMYTWCLEPFDWLMELLGFRLTERALGHVARLRVCAVLRKDPNVVAAVRGLYQASTASGVLLDGEATDEMRQRAWAALPPGVRESGASMLEVAWLGKDPAALLTSDWVPPKSTFPEALTSFPEYWGVPLSEEAVVICPETCRPYYIDGWEHIAHATHGTPLDPAKRLNMTAGFMRYTQRYRMYPSAGELLYFLEKRHGTLPRQAEAWERTIIDVEFAEIRRLLPPQEAADRFMRSAAIETRVQMEKSV